MLMSSLINTKAAATDEPQPQFAHRHKDGFANGLRFWNFDGSSMLQLARAKR
jgi:hypothetical protein